MIIAVADAGPIIHLAEIDSLYLFSTLDELLIPKSVYEELQAGGLPADLTDIDYELVEASNASEWTDSDLDAGEVAALTIASAEDAMLLTADLDARRAAKDAEIVYTDLLASSHWRTHEASSTTPPQPSE